MIDECLTQASPVVNGNTPLEKLRKNLAEISSKGRKLHSLYDKVYRSDVLEEAYRIVRSHVLQKKSIIDRREISIIDKDKDVFLAGLAEELHTKSYTPQRYRIQPIDKGNGKIRILKIPAVRDRVVQMAVLLLLEPIFEPTFSDTSHAYRKGRGVKSAIDNMTNLIGEGYKYVVDLDIQGCFDNLDREFLETQLKKRVVDDSVLSLIKRLVYVGRNGIPQGAVLSPLLANIYLTALDDAWNEYPGIMVRYADDFIILCKTHDEAEVVETVIADEWIELETSRSVLRNLLKH
jgi:group II intron reverse transcriptase/maturase